ncbi:MAG: biotin--[acetyl-CoA-carboxylase] ligase [Bacteroidetes bacterium]|nr:biotin--[acetyl-CoA-carboxylase] ligase [Bacteroidota bacterium]
MSRFKKNIIYLDTVDSTNRYAKQLLASQPVPEGTLILAGSQIAGMGLGTNTWESEPGKNLTFSLVLHPVFLPVEKQFFLNQAISLGIVDFINSMINEDGLCLKWPNDIYFLNQKMGGILINNTLSGQVFETAIVGIGLNINQVIFPITIPNPVSLKQVIKRDTDLKLAIDIVYDAIEARYMELGNGTFRQLQKEYTAQLLGLDTWRNYSSGDHIFEGRIIGITEYGQLKVETHSRKILNFDYKEIEYIF